MSILRRVNDVQLQLGDFNRSEFPASLVAYRPRLARAPCGPPRGEDEVDHVVDALAFPDGREDSRAVPAHQLRIPIHDLERRPDVRRQVDLFRRKVELVSAPSKGNLICRTLLMTSKSDCEIPGPPLRGILSPPYRHAR